MDTITLTPMELAAIMQEIGDTPRRYMMQTERILVAKVQAAQAAEQQKVQPK